ncbi:hypothetical protein FNF27_01634 [Cafeteria roenbergensis]|uniref:Choline transporter-like protein n=1 Tax=Cafeteria roenbergensis TaxID=33653 RepID=A0A5A8E2D3_CAFRO|nr:hypothetical protein FNF29_03960 [Cafeteria roenbergensis]KAA0167838.1 hypothetical protein FNF31_00773 [Cafeteria roenbergensis]KAA0171619.1 hypothetical protein FNF28_00552 [Cafeteria roenbergensis]KAA0176812.1 hypothetical protein FNF27_01634 [Cafeteria roenbergensis]|eukprot:KAA0152394.1 hypothetical protein FNF29_03960 [Cafeteria roenbergensis]
MAYAGDYGGAPKNAVEVAPPRGHDAYYAGDARGARSGGAVPVAPVIMAPPEGMITVDRGDGSEPPAPTCKDPVWAALLALNVVVQAILAVVYGIPVLNSAGTDEVVTSDEGSGKGLSTRTLGIVFVICVGLGAVASVLFLLCLVRCAERLVRVTVFASIGLNVLLAIVSVFLSPFLALIWIIFAVLGVCFWCSVRNRIAFAAAHLEIAGTAVRKHSLTICWAYASLAMGAIYCIVWAVAVVGVSSKLVEQRAVRDEASALEAVAYVLELLAFFWGVNFVRFSLHVVVSGTVGTWWAVAEPKDPTVGSIRRAFTTSCGSVAFAALLIAIIQTIRQMLREAQRSAMRNGGAAAACCLGIVHCLIQIIENLARYISEYALVRVALFGEDFITAGRATFAMFRERGWTAVINDVIISRTLTLAMLLFGALTGVVGAGAAYFFIPGVGQDIKGAVALLAGLGGFILGMACCSIVSMVIESGVITAFVAFGEQPEGLHVNHPVLFQKMLEAWAEFYPDAVVAAGYDRRYGVDAVGHHARDEP